MLPQTFSAATTCRPEPARAEEPGRATARAPARATSAAVATIRGVFFFFFTRAANDTHSLYRLSSRRAIVSAMATRTASGSWAETTLAALHARGFRSGGARRA